jgi:hypothetical protein
MSKTREIILQALHHAYGKDAEWFSESSSSRYLCGYTAARRRGICLIDNIATPAITKEAIFVAYQEVKQAGLTTPFLFFGPSKLYSDDAYIFMPIRFEHTQIIFPRILYRS